VRQTIARRQDSGLGKIPLSAALPARRGHAPPTSIGSAARNPATP
jgi:hypothetical protein